MASDARKTQNLLHSITVSRLWLKFMVNLAWYTRGVGREIQGLAIALTDTGELRNVSEEVTMAEINH